MRSYPSHRPARRRLARPIAAAAASVGVALSVVSGTSWAAAATLDGVVSADALSGIRALSVSTTEAQDTLADAHSALAEATALSSDIAASGLDLGADATIDTEPLEDAATRLAEANVVPVLLFADLAHDAAAHTETVSERVGEVRGALDDALARKAAEEAAAQAQREAEAAAAAAAAALAAANTPEGAQATAQRMAAERYGWGADQFSCLLSLWHKESNWNYQAYNPSSGATGIPQALPGSKMASAGADWQTNATTQVAWGLDYISRAYGSPCAAWGHSQATNWY